MRICHKLRIMIYLISCTRGPLRNESEWGRKEEKGEEGEKELRTVKIR